MPTVNSNGIKIYYESHGQGFPLIWAHEFAGDYRSWEPQVRFFSRRYNVITYNARGYPPTEVPDDESLYSQDNAIEDLRGLMKALNIEVAHIGGLSMGGALTLNFGIRYPEMAKSLIVAAAGTGSTDPEGFKKNVLNRALNLETHGMASMKDYAEGPARIQFKRKDPNGWQEFSDHLMSHSSVGSAMTFRGVQSPRPPIYSLEEGMKSLKIPTLIMFGDEDEPCIDPGIFMKRSIPSSGLVVFPQSGHAINLEEPDLFNRAVQDFLAMVENDAWAIRSSGNETGSLL